MISFIDFLIENSLYTNQQEKDALINDKSLLMDALIINYFGFLGLYKLSDKRGNIKNYEQTEGRLQLKNISDNNHDVSLVVKLSFEQGLITQSVANNMTKLLFLIKSKTIKGKDIDDAKLRDFFAGIHWQSNAPSPLLKSAIQTFLNGGSIELFAKDIWNACKVNKQLSSVSSEFKDLVKGGQYLALFNKIQPANSLGQVQSTTTTQTTAQQQPVAQTATQQQSTAQTIVQKIKSAIDNVQQMINPTPQLDNHQLDNLMVELLQAYANDFDPNFNVLCQKYNIKDEDVFMTSEFIDKLKDTILHIKQTIKTSPIMFVMKRDYSLYNTIVYKMAKKGKFLNDLLFVYTFQNVKYAAEKADFDIMNKFIQRGIEYDKKDNIETISKVVAKDQFIFNFLMPKVNDMVVKFLSNSIDTYIKLPSRTAFEVDNQMCMEYAKAFNFYGDIHYRMGDKLYLKYMIWSLYPDLSAKEVFEKYTFGLSVEFDKPTEILSENVERLLDKAQVPYTIENANENVFVVKSTAGLLDRIPMTLREYFDYVKNKRASKNCKIYMFQEVKKEAYNINDFVNSFITYINNKSFTNAGVVSNTAILNDVNYVIENCDPQTVFNQIKQSKKYQETMANLCTLAQLYLDRPGTFLFKIKDFPEFVMGIILEYVKSKPNLESIRKDSYGVKNNLYSISSWLISVMTKEQSFSSSFIKECFVPLFNAFFDKPDYENILQYTNFESNKDTLLDYLMKKNKFDLLYRVLPPEFIVGHLMNNNVNISKWPPINDKELAKRLLIASTKVSNIPMNVRTKINSLYYPKFTAEEILQIYNSFSNSEKSGYFMSFWDGIYFQKTKENVYLLANFAKKTLESYEDSFDNFLTKKVVFSAKINFLITQNKYFAEWFLENSKNQYLIVLAQMYAAPKEFAQNNILNKENFEKTLTAIQLPERRFYIKDVQQFFFDKITDFDKDEFKSGIENLFEMSKKYFDSDVSNNISYLASVNIFNLYKSKETKAKANEIYQVLPTALKRKVTNKIISYTFVDIAKKVLYDPSNLIVPEKELDTNRIQTLLEYNSIEIPQVRLSKNKKIDDIVEEVSQFEKIQQKPKVENVEIPDNMNEQEYYERLTIEYNNKYNRYKHGNLAPLILKVFNVNIPEQVQHFNEFVKEHPNTKILEPVFHGTGSIAASMILRYGFAVINPKDPMTVGRMLGNGIYFSTVLDKCAQYVSDYGYSRNVGNTGYIFEMRAALGDKNKNYKAAGLGNDGVISPEWCVFEPNRQLIITKAFYVKLVTKNDIDNLKKKYLVEKDENIIQIKSFKEFLTEGDNMYSNATTYTFLEGKIPDDQKNVFDFQDPNLKLPSHMRIDPCGLGPMVTIYHNNTQSEAFCISNVYDFINEMPEEYEKYCKLFKGFPV